jgi:hypothetical protein
MRRWARWTVRIVGVAVAATGVMGSPRSARAQAWNYPDFQQSHIVYREFEGAVASGGNGGTDFLFQWREGIATSSQFSFDAGVVTSAHGGGHEVGFVGGQYAYQLAQPSPSLPVEILGLTGLGFAFGNAVNYFTIPAGVSVGRKFSLGPAVAITPFAEPHVMLEFCTTCGVGDRGRSELGVGIDLGANLDLSPVFSLRGGVSFGGTSVVSRDPSFGIGLAWRPPRLIPR